MPGKSPGGALPLDPESVETLNSALEGSDLASCVVDPESRLAVITLNVFRILPEDGVLEEEYPLCLAAHPVGRVAASHVVEGSVQPLELGNIDQVLSGFSYRDIEDWDIVDPPASLRFKWRDSVSLDMRWGDNENHFLELWQDDSPLQLFDIALWFDDLYVFDKQLHPVSLEMIAEWRRRLRAAADVSVGPGKGVPRSIPAASPAVPISSVLERIEGA
jgi:hypothetical protein